MQTALEKSKTSTNRLDYFFPPEKKIWTLLLKALLSAEEHDGFSMWPAYPKHSMVRKWGIFPSWLVLMKALQVAHCVWTFLHS